MTTPLTGKVVRPKVSSFALPDRDIYVESRRLLSETGLTNAHANVIRIAVSVAVNGKRNWFFHFPTTFSSGS